MRKKETNTNKELLTMIDELADAIIQAILNDDYIMQEEYTISMRGCLSLLKENK